MKVDFESLTDHELADVITAAANEWKMRKHVDRTPVVKTSKTRQPSSASINEPPPDDKRFVLHIKAIAANGDLVRASERRGVAAIAAQYPEWVKRQGLPTEGGTAAWRNLAYSFKIGTAPEQ